MRQMYCDLAIIGGGPAGLAAAVEAKRQGVQRVLVIERDVAPGGILRQCVHDGFGLHRFGQRMTGGQNAGNRDLDQLFINASLIFLPLFLKCHDHIRSSFF